MIKTCENCKYEDRLQTEQPCCSCIHNAVERFEPKESRWIPVKHRLPKLREEVLVTSRNYVVHKGWRIPAGWRVDTYVIKNTEIIAWMPLPAPYKGGSDEM